MKKKGNKKKPKIVGLPPGSIVFTGNQKVEKVIIHYLVYDSTHFSETTIDNHSQITFKTSDDTQTDWYDIRGLHDINLIETLGRHFDIHPLVLEDIVDIIQRPKLDEYEKGLFITLRALVFDKATLEIKVEQIALYFRKGLLISFQETESDLFLAVRRRIQSGQGRIRDRGSDYLAYALIDNIVDSYYPILDEFEAVIEVLEDKIISDPEENIREQIHHLKKELLVVRKSIAPLREAIGRFAKTEVSFMDEKSKVYIRDLYDHTVQVMDMVESYRDMLNGLQDLYLSEISFKMNQVMQVLTIITSIFVPLSFLTGMYGMNFVNMPELRFKYGYFILLGVMLAIFVGSIVYFRRRKWF
ncbi:MAG: magnesium/cobalt transporter CorA [Bacteroidota bacterium]